MQFGIPISHSASPAALTLYAGNAPREGGNGSVQALLFSFPCHFSWQLPAQFGKQKSFLLLAQTLPKNRKEQKKKNGERKGKMGEKKKHRTYSGQFFKTKAGDPSVTNRICSSSSSSPPLYVNIDSRISWFVQYIT